MSTREQIAWRAAVLVVLLALLSTACGTESAAITEIAETRESTEPAATAEPAEGAQADGDGGEAGEQKTLDEYLGSYSRAARGPGAGRGGNATATEEQAQVEVEVQRCMQAQGFEYVPEETTDGLRQFLAQANQGLTPEAFAETKGFGISTRFDEVLDGDVVLEAEEESANDIHLTTLSDGEVEAWQFALRGEPLERNAQGQPIDPETGEVIPARQRGSLAGGCRADANTIVRGDRSVIESLAAEFGELDARIAADPRIAQIARDWASCMRDAGFTYETVNEARGEINEEFRPLIRSAFGRGPGQGQRDFSDISLTPEQEADLRQLQDREIAIAVAAHECEGDTEAEVAEIQARYEAEFVEQNRDVLDSISSS